MLAYLSTPFLSFFLAQKELHINAAKFIDSILYNSE